jgi:HEPN domain-containing protein
MDSEEWQRWLTQAQDDFAYGVAGVDDFPRGAAWNFHQASEKSIKALLLKENVTFPITHDLVRLLVLLPPSKHANEAIREAAFLLASFCRSPAIREICLK